MKLVLMEHSAVGGATWSCLELQDHMRPEVWTMMGHRVVEVPDAQGKQMIEDMGKAMMLQVQLRELYYREATTDFK
jgi:hypothetical protein